MFTLCPQNLVILSIKDLGTCSPKMVLYLSHAKWTYRRRLGSLLLWACVQCVTSIVWALILPIVCWFFINKQQNRHLYFAFKGGQAQTSLHKSWLGGIEKLPGDRTQGLISFFISSEGLSTTTSNRIYCCRKEYKWLICHLLQARTEEIDTTINSLFHKLWIFEYGLNSPEPDSPSEAYLPWGNAEEEIANNTLQ